MKPKIPFAKPYVNYNSIKTELKNILESGQVSNGNWCRALEREVKLITGAKHAIVTNSCTTAIMMTLQYMKETYGIKTVYMPSFTWVSPKYIVKALGLKIKWLDIHSKTLHCITPKKLKKKEAFFPLSTFGSLYAPLQDQFAGKQNRIIIDSAHCSGLIPNHNISLCNVFSMSPTKTFTATEGGVITTDDDEFYNYLLKLRHVIGRMPEVNALIGYNNLKNYYKIIKEKKKIHNYYKKHLEPFGVNFQKSSYTNCNITFVWSNNTFPIKQMISAFEDNNIEYRTRYSPYDYINERKMKMSMKMYKHGLCLPSYPGIDYKYIVKVIKKRLKKHEN